jgi:hypothetical protein
METQPRIIALRQGRTEADCINAQGKASGADAFCFPLRKTGAGEESRTLDLYLGKVSLYQLSYSRKNLEARAGVEPTYTDLQSGA